MVSNIYGELNQFIEDFSNEIFHSLDPIFVRTLRKLIDKNLVFQKYKKFKSSIIKWLVFFYSIVGIVIASEKLMEKFIALPIIYILMLFLIMFTSTASAVLYFKTTAKKKKDFDDLRVYVINRSKVILKHDKDRYKLAVHLEEVYGINIFHP